LQDVSAHLTNASFRSDPKAINAFFFSARLMSGFNNIDSFPKLKHFSYFLIQAVGREQNN